MYSITLEIYLGPHPGAGHQDARMLERDGSLPHLVFLLHRGRNVTAPPHILFQKLPFQ